jgi:hypothetical protein
MHPAGMTKHERHPGCRGRLLLYSRSPRGGGARVTVECAPAEHEEVGRLIRRWQLRLEARGQRFQGFRLQPWPTR